MGTQRHSTPIIAALAFRAPGWRAVTRVRRWLPRNRRGIAGAEFALIAIVMLNLVLAAYDAGTVVLQTSQLAQAVRAGGQFAMSFPTDTAGMTRVVTANLPTNISGATTAVILDCVTSGTADNPCDAGGTVVTAWDRCPAGTTERFVHLTATVTYTPFLLTPLTSNTACYAARIQ